MGCDKTVTLVDQSCVGAPIGTRRRGAALEQAILDAVIAELAEAGYRGFSVEAVAARARTGKASIYRRWPTKQDLVADALESAVPCLDADAMVDRFDDSVTTAQALFGVARTMTAVINSTAGEAMRTIKCEAAVDPELAKMIDERFQAPRRAAMLRLLQRGVERGEVRPGAVSEEVVDVIPAMLMHRVLMLNEPVTEQVLIDLMERIVLPLVEAR